MEENHVIDLSDLLARIDAEIAQAAEQLARLRGRREGVLLAVQAAQQQMQPVTRTGTTNGVEQPA
jgi:hypothetical protein